ncbi:hypothetical protein E3T27_02840 [Cryobacterium lyxosi]|uniref:Uncharacterized protein n=1 Tax=Cryobacterium lyxosi TaxID=1259228 RepID=A0A4R8ZIH6_9MICO|nr:hypothetical protein E3T27_02840 [Cryobacterium lyxosi]
MECHHETHPSFVPDRTRSQRPTGRRVCRASLQCAPPTSCRSRWCRPLAVDDYDRHGRCPCFHRMPGRLRPRSDRGGGPP